MDARNTKTDTRNRNADRDAYDKLAAHGRREIAAWMKDADLADPRDTAFIAYEYAQQLRALDCARKFG